MFLIYALLLVGVFACSTAVIFIKLSAMPSIMLAALRLLVSVAILSPLFWRQWRRHRAQYPAREFRRSLLPGLILALHFIAWIIGARMTTAINASIIANLIPVVMPFFLYFMIKESLTAREWIATVLAVGGFAGLSISDFNISIEFFKGDVLCFVSMLFLAYYLALGRRHRDVPGLWLYVVPLYFFSGLICLAVSLAVREDMPPWTWREAGLILALAAIPTVVGHSTMNYAMKHLRGQVVSIFNTGQFVFAGLMAYPLFHEAPQGMTYAAAALLVISAFILLGEQAPAAAMPADAEEPVTAPES
jgi:drug/metabolite transporter (DMT)-like permease